MTWSHIAYGVPSKTVTEGKIERLRKFKEGEEEGGRGEEIFDLP
jgi:hypothetical protein